MALLTQTGQDVLKDQNFVSHTRIYVDDILQVDTSSGVVGAPVVSYQINRSRKLGAAKLSLNVANPGGVYSFKRQEKPLFGYGNKIKLQEGILVGQTMEWFTRFTGIIVSQVPSNTGGKLSLNVNALDNMKMMLDYLPDELYYCPDVIAVKGEELAEVPGGDLMRYRGSQENLPWVDIPYPIFYKAGTKVKENYEVDLISGEVYFGEKMTGTGSSASQKYEATRVSETIYTIPVPIEPGSEVYRSFILNTDGTQQLFQDNKIPTSVTVTYNGNQIIFSKSPFHDLYSGFSRSYSERKIYLKTGAPCTVTADYWYYDDNTNLAENVIKDLALQAGFTAERIILQETNVSLKPIRFTNLTIKSGFEALQKIKQQLSPNYIITCDVEGNLRGYYASQRLSSDYDLQLIKKIDAPVSEENLYSVVVSHGADLNPTDLRNGATAQNLLLPTPVIKVGGSADMVLNKKADDQMTWHWIQKNDDKPPEFPFDLLTISLNEARKIEEINVLVGDYNKGTIQQSISVQVSEDDTNWFYIDMSSRGLSGTSSQWVTMKGGELENRKIKGIKFIGENAFSWNESHSYSKGSFLSPKVVTDNFYHWYFAIKEVQIWQENTISVTSSICNCIGIGNGTRDTFYIPNIPVVPGSVTLYRDGIALAPTEYSMDSKTGKIDFLLAPTGVITADYTTETKQQPRTQTSNIDRFVNNSTVVNPPLAVAFTGGAIDVASSNYKLLKRLGLKKNALQIDNYLNSFSDVQRRGAEMLQEISRLEETLGIDVIYRPDIDICQTVGIVDSLLGIAGCYFVEEITESKQGFKPSLNVRVSNYS